MDTIETIRHSLAHVLAQTILSLYPNVKLGMGPAVENGFYYDFDVNTAISVDDLPKIQEKMSEIIKSNASFVKSEMAPEEARRVFTSQPYKLEIIDDLEAGGAKEVTVYKTGDFIDLCLGPHVTSATEIDGQAFKLTRVAGAYWKNSEKNKQMQRIYGVAFGSKDELDKYLESIEEAQRRDHRKLGRDLDLFTLHEEAPGMVFWHSRGLQLFKTLVERWREIQQKYGYKEVSLPNVLDVNLWKRSGHYEHFKENMFFTDNEGRKLALRPMDCPGAILLYGEDVRSYNDLPIKMSELGTVFRNEKSGELHGLFRVQQITQDDAHVFVTPEQIEKQVSEIIEIMEKIYAPFDMKREIFLSTKPDKAMGNDEMWQKAEASLKSALDKSGIKYGIKEKDGAFYGPKIDIHIKDSLGRSWQTGTIQLDFFMPQQFDIKYIDKNGAKQTPVILHRALMGSLERFIGILTEHYAGAFPVWLAPVQVAVIPVSEKNNPYADSVAAKLKDANIRAVVDKSNETLGKKIRANELQKIPYLIIVGDKETDNQKINVRIRGEKEQSDLDLNDFIPKIKKI